MKNISTIGDNVRMDFYELESVVVDTQPATISERTTVETKAISDARTIPTLENICAEIIFNSNKANILELYSLAESIYNVYLIKKCRDIVRQRFPFYLERYGAAELAQIIDAEDMHFLTKEHEDRLAAERLFSQKGTVLERPTVAINPSEGLERGEYPLRALVQGVAWPEDVDPTKREEYLSAAEFEEVFGMTKEEFRALPRYVRIRTKKEKLLF